MATRKIYNSLQVLGNGTDDILSLKGSDNNIKISIDDTGSTKDALGGLSINPNARLLVDLSGVISISWDTRKFIDSSGFQSLDYTARILQDNLENTSLNWDLRDLSGDWTAVTQAPNDNSTKLATTAYVDAGLASQNTLAEVLGNGREVDATGTILTSSSGNAIDVNSRNLLSITGIHVVDWGNAQLVSGSLLPVKLDWSVGALYNSNSVMTVDWENQILRDATENINVLVWSSGTLLDIVPAPSLNWFNRALIGADGVTTNLDWGAKSLVGNWTSTTQAPNDNSTKLATTAYVDNAISSVDFPDITLNYIPQGTGTTITDGTWYFSGNDLVPLVDGSNIGSNASPQQRIGTIYMASTLDYGNDLTFISGTERARLTTSGNFHIGSGVPNGKLHVTGTSGGYATLIEWNEGSNILFRSFENGEMHWNAGVVGGETTKHAGGRWDFPNQVTVGGFSPTVEIFSIKGSGSSSATTNLKIVKNDGTQVINSRDDGRVFIGSTTFDPTYSVFSDVLSTKLAVQSSTSLFASFTNTSGLGIIIGTTTESGNTYITGLQPSGGVGTGIIAFKATNGHMAYGLSSLEHNDDKHNFWLGVNADKFSIINYDTRTSGQGTNITFRARSENGSNTYPEVAVIKGLAFENAGSGTNSGYLTFLTANNASPTERMRIDKDGNIGIGTTSPAEDAILDITSTTKAFLPPRVTTAQRDLIGIGSPLTPTEGLVVYNTTTNDIEFYDGAVWKGINAGITSGFTGSQHVTKQAGVQTTNDTLTNIATVALSDGEMIQITAEVNGFASDFSASYAAKHWAVFRKTGGTVTQVGTTVTGGFELEDFSAAVDSTIAVDGTAGLKITVQATSSPDITVNWVTTYSYFKTLTNS